MLLPTPSLTNDSFYDPRQTLGNEARALGLSVEQIRRTAVDEIADWLVLAGEPDDRFEALLGGAS